MLFNSYVFIFVFLPVTLLGYYLFHRLDRARLAKGWLVLCSLFFYGYFNFSYLWIIVSSIACNYLISGFMKSAGKRKTWRKAALGLGVFLNIGLLFFYKYLDFVFETVGAIFRADPIHLGLILPLGISFFTFQQISFLIDSYHGKVRAYDFLDYALFVTFFPQLIAGPIVLHSEVIPQFEDRRNHVFRAENFAKGLFAFARGLFKKVLIADSFGKIVSLGYANIPELSSFGAVLAILAYTFQIYFDFSGYCDMAGGIAYMFNIELPVNFDSPYKARNIADFWKRWHMTLTRFLTHYVYFPLGGSRRGTARTCLNVLAVFLLSGIWHGAGFTFILWGAMHGVAMVAYRLLKKPIDRLPGAVTRMATFVFVNVTWVFFRAESIADAAALIARVFSGGMALGEELTETLLNIIPISVAANLLHMKGSVNVLMIFTVLATTAVCLYTRNVQERTRSFQPTVRNLFSTCLLLVWSILSLSGVSTFLYFNF